MIREPGDSAAVAVNDSWNAARAASSMKHVAALEPGLPGGTRQVLNRSPPSCSKRACEVSRT